MPLEIGFEIPFDFPFSTPFELRFDAPFAIPFELRFSMPFAAPCSIPFAVPGSTPCAAPSRTPCSVPSVLRFDFPLEFPFEFPLEVPPFLSPGHPRPVRLTASLLSAHLHHPLRRLWSYRHVCRLAGLEPRFRRQHRCRVCVRNGDTILISAGTGAPFREASGQRSARASSQQSVDSGRGRTLPADRFRPALQFSLLGLSDPLPQTGRQVPRFT
jgi:hypothetical protein